MKEIQQLKFYDYKTMEELSDADEEFDQQKEEEEADGINVVKECLRLLLLSESEEESKSTLQREESLTTIIKALEEGSPYYNNKIVDNYNVFVSLFYQCMISIENGSPKEVCLGSYILGFLALSTVHLGCDVASTILHESLPLIYKRLKLPFVFDSTKTVSLLNCLAIINFLVGVGSNKEEEAVSDVIWQKVKIILGEAKGQALLAYGFSLMYNPPAIDDSKIWYLFSVLDNCTESRVGAICAQVLALFFETYDLPDDLREKALHIVNYRLAVEVNKSLSNVFKQVAEFLEHGCLPISKRKDAKRKDDLYVQTSSWADLIRLKFLKPFLGKKGFSEHMQKNKLLQDVLKVSSSSSLNVAGAEKKRDENYVRMGKMLVQRKKLRVVDNKRRILKERTQNLEKGRKTKAAVGCYDVSY